MAESISGTANHLTAPIGRRFAAGCRIAWTVTTIVMVQALVTALAVLPVAIVWTVILGSTETTSTRLLLFAIGAGPSYVLFALTLMFASAAITTALGWRTPANAEMRIRDVDWPLLQWVRYMAAIHVVRVAAGPLLRGTPVWTAYLRASGARIGPRVYVNTLALSDYNLLEFGDDVVIGADVHIAGHTVERGLVRTGTVRLGSQVTVGLGSIIDIDVTVGARSEIGALSVVPKHSILEADATYVGAPARRLNR